MVGLGRAMPGGLAVAFTCVFNRVYIPHPVPNAQVVLLAAAAYFVPGCLEPASIVVATLVPKSVKYIGAGYLASPRKHKFLSLFHIERKQKSPTSKDIFASPCNQIFTRECVGIKMLTLPPPPALQIVSLKQNPEFSQSIKIVAETPAFNTTGSK